MAAVLCGLSPVGSGLKTLNEYLLNHNPTPRQRSGSISWLAVWKSSGLIHDARRALVRTRGGDFRVGKSEQDLLKRRAESESSSADLDMRQDQEVSRATLIWRAIKLPIYSVALIPLTVGSAAAYYQTGAFSTRRYIMLLISSVFVITWLNLSNDVYDFDTGADKDKKESVVNLVGSRAWTAVAAYSLLVLGFLGLTRASLEARNTRSIALLISAIACGYIYQEGRRI